MFWKKRKQKKENESIKQNKKIKIKNRSLAHKIRNYVAIALIPLTLYVGSGFILNNISTPDKQINQTRKDIDVIEYNYNQRKSDFYNEFVLETVLLNYVVDELYKKNDEKINVSLDVVVDASVKDFYDNCYKEGICKENESWMSRITTALAGLKIYDQFDINFTINKVLPLDMQIYERINKDRCYVYLSEDIDSFQLLDEIKQKYLANFDNNGKKSAELIITFVQYGANISPIRGLVDDIGGDYTFVVLDEKDENNIHTTVHEIGHLFSAEHLEQIRKMSYPIIDTLVDPFHFIELEVGIMGYKAGSRPMTKFDFVEENKNRINGNKNRFED